MSPASSCTAARPRVLIGLLLALSWVAADGASLGGQADAFAKTRDGVSDAQQGTWTDSATHAVTATAVSPITPGRQRVNAGEASADGTAQFGRLHIDGMGRADEFSFASAHSRASFLDRLVFTSPATTGMAVVHYGFAFGPDPGATLGYQPDADNPPVPVATVASYTFSLTSLLNGQRNALVEVHAELDTRGVVSSFQRIDGNDVPGRLFGFVMDVGVLMPLGVPQTIEMILEGSATGGLPDASLPGAARGDYHPTMFWGGITGFSDLAGHEIPFAVMSESGTDYRFSFLPPVPAIPEPSAAWLLFAGLLLLLGRARTGAERG